MSTTVDLAPSALVALPRASLAALRSALARDLGGGFAGYLQDAGYAGGESMFGAFRTWLVANGHPDAEALSVDAFQARAAEYFRITGWGPVTISPLHDVVAEVDSEDWAEADPTSGMQFPSCHYTTGLFADFFGRTAAAPLAVLEVECRSSGSHRCRFLVGSAEVMGHLYDRMSVGVAYADAARELA